MVFWHQLGTNFHSRISTLLLMGNSPLTLLDSRDYLITGEMLLPPYH